MAGELSLVKTEPTTTTTEKSQGPTMADCRRHQWLAQYSRCFSYPSSHLSTYTSPLPSLSLVEKHNFKPTWLSSSSPSSVSLLPSDPSVITISLLGVVLEEHHLSKLTFVWPQVSCLSGFPARGSLAVIASYIDSSDEKQKFALRFSTVPELEDFVTTVENILLNKLLIEPPAVDVISAISSQSEFIPPYRPDTSSMMSPIYASSVPKNFHNEDEQGSQTQAHVQGTEADSESNSAFPPRFTSLVSNCSAEPDHSNLALTLASELQEPHLQAHIAKYMQDASFLDIVNKVNEVITELGGDYAI